MENENQDYKLGELNASFLALDKRLDKLESSIIVQLQRLTASVDDLRFWKTKVMAVSSAASLIVAMIAQIIFTWAK